MKIYKIALAPGWKKFLVVIDKDGNATKKLIEGADCQKGVANGHIRDANDINRMSPARAGFEGVYEGLRNKLSGEGRINAPEVQPVEPVEAAPEAEAPFEPGMGRQKQEREMEGQTGMGV